MSAKTVLAGGLLLISLHLRAEENWLTITGIPSDVNNDYVQLNPAALGKEGELVTIPIRISRAHERTSQDGIKFRSFVGVVGVDCAQHTARFLRASFYSEPAFQGKSHITKEYGQVVRPVAFREIPGDHAERTIRAACKATS